MRAPHGAMDWAPHTEVWSPAGNEPLAAWECPRQLRRVFDAEVRGWTAELPPGGPPRPVMHGAAGRRVARAAWRHARGTPAPRPLH